MTNDDLKTIEVCKYISETASELRRLAEIADAQPLATLLTEIVEQAEELARKRQRADIDPETIASERAQQTDPVSDR